MSSINHQPGFQSQCNEALLPWTGCSEGSSPTCKTVLSDLPSLAAEVAPAILGSKCTGTIPGTCAVTEPPHQRWPGSQGAAAEQEALLGLQELCRASDNPSEKYSWKESYLQHEVMFSPPVAPGMPELGWRQFGTSCSCALGWWAVSKRFWAEIAINVRQVPRSPDYSGPLYEHGRPEMISPPAPLQPRSFERLHEAAGFKL